MKLALLARAFLGLALAASHAAGAHPLDPLSKAEIGNAVALLRAAGDADDGTQYAYVGLDEPGKGAVLAWRAGAPITRKAFVVARRQGRVFEGVVDLIAKKVARWEPVPGAESAILPPEMNEARQIVRADPGWRAALQARGFDAASPDLNCAVMAAGPPADAGEQGRRLVRLTCYDAAGGRNVWSRPIEGLVAVVDLDAHTVLRIIDRQRVPLGEERGDFASASPAGAAPARSYPFVRSGNSITWRNWSFHYRMDPRTGLVISLLRYADQGRERMVLYRGSLSEMFVPYMDPDPAWTARAFMDVGENGVGALSLPLHAGVDCPANAAMLDAVLADSAGAARERRGVICLFEREGDMPLWRHAETANGTYAGRAAHELVMRMIPTLGNYDYVIDWVLTEWGAIRIEVGATGIDQVKAVAAQSMVDPSAAADTAYGTLIAPGRVGVNHDHFFSFRLDLDIDGPLNRLVERRLVTQPREGERPGLWRVAERVVEGEGPLGIDAHAGKVSWRIENPTVTSRLGQHPGYQVRGDHMSAVLVTPDDPRQRRAAFAAAPLWVTAYDPAELYAAGPYPNQNPAAAGLPAYAARHRPVDGADLVLWGTLGFHHIPRPEDWPLLPTMRHSLTLTPNGFFDR